MTYTYNRKGITRKVLSEIVRGLGAKDETFPTSRSKYWLDKDFAFVRVFGTIRATRKTGDKGVTVFHNLTLTLFLRCIFQIPPCVNRKIVATRKCSWHVCASCHYDVSSFPTYLQRTAPPARVNLLGWGVVAGSCWIVLKTAVKRDAVLCGATCRKIFVFPTYESVACSITTQLLTLT